MRARPSTVALSLYVIGLMTLIFVICSQVYVEWVQASISKKLNPLRRYIPVACDPDPRNHGKIVHIDCPIDNYVTFYPASEFNWNVQPVKGLFFDTKVEMYQWSTGHSKLGISYNRRWSENKEMGGNGWLASRENPNYWPAVTGHGRQFPPKFFAGGFELDPTLISEFRETIQVKLQPDDYYQQSPVRPPQNLSSRNTQVIADYLYSGNALSPAVGDVRVSFYSSSATHVSAIGQQQCRYGKCYIVPVKQEEVTQQERLRALGWASRDSDVDPDDRYSNAINVAKKSFDWIYRAGAPYVDSNPRIQNLEKEVIVVKEGDHNGYQLLYDAVSGGSHQKSKRWLFRWLTFLTSGAIGAWSYGLFHPTKGFHEDITLATEVLWLACGAIGSGVFVTSLVASSAWMLTDVLMGVLLIITAGLGLGLAIFVGETALEPTSEKSGVRGNYAYTELTEEPIHGAPPKETMSRRQDASSMVVENCVIEERSDSSYYSPL
eukprot:GHVH01014092.1.p1 GENE.GHVH01014092.1~~GHVH01014092.1.p1  ORF type:complete len:491 (-),score=56.26 GHVH01014092.1:65-1537(-)